MRVLALIAVLSLGCAAQIGPDKVMLAKWDICGWEGGVRFDAEFMSFKLGLGCVTAAEAEAEDSDPE